MFIFSAFQPLSCKSMRPTQAPGQRLASHGTPPGVKGIATCQRAGSYSDPPASLPFHVAKFHTVPDLILSPVSQQHISASMSQIITPSSKTSRENAALGGQSQEPLIHNWFSADSRSGLFSNTVSAWCKRQGSQGRGFVPGWAEVPPYPIPAPSHHAA